MNENESINIEELLNAYVDGECSERQSSEIKRMIAHDRQIAKRVLDLQKCKALVNAMPRAEAPEGISEQVRSRIERTTLLKEYDRSHGRAGIVHLFARKMTAWAAMLALVGVLGAVVYSIVRPHGARQQININTNFVAKAPEKKLESPALTKSERKHLKSLDAAAKPAAPVAQAVAAAGPMNMDLEVWTDQYIAVTSYVYHGIIIDNGLLEGAKVDRQEKKSTYTIACSRAAMNSVVNDLESVWGKFKGTRLSMGPDRQAWAAVIDGVGPEQFVQILTQKSGDEQIKLARDFSTINNAAAKGPGDEAIAMASESNSLQISKPVLTSGDKPAAAKEAASGEKVNLTITVYGQ